MLGRTGWISVRNVCKTFEVGEGRPALLDDCSFEVRPGEFWAIYGPKDRGKTVLLNLIAGFERVTDGIVVVDGEVTNRPGMRPLHGPDHIVGYRSAIHVLRPTVAAYLHEGEENGDKVRVLCDQLGLARHMGSRLRDVPREVSRRVEIVRAFLRDPYVVLDEPARGLEGPDKAALTAFVLDVHALLPKTTMVATEDIDEAVFIADHVLVMKPAGAKKLPVAIDLRRPRAADQRALPEFARAKQDVLRCAYASPAKSNSRCRCASCQRSPTR